ncbi:peptidase E [Paenibacillus sp. TRM 82003]|uniref:Type 1 glutamine amidotransferase-like domain-containing protein n=1 Tax=Kineococcus sp. TRM81007 TaxID=2925831 RepID=UPI001F593724|nr:peptidase E [Kineococcus sp. TRM81007]MCI2237743.1 peptidase E [Kineococcus sp. TRM81007]MCI3921761.1 peptidase E [Paenibacillus sp. TRM 82003]
MRLLLTSAGLVNEGSCAAVAALARRPLPSLALAVVPTAANVVPGDKGWLIADFVNFQRAGFAQVDVVDVSALEPQVWRARLEEADVLAVTGGDTTHLLRQVRGSGLAGVLGELLRERVYVGVSAGSMVTGPHLRLSRSVQERPEDSAGLGLVDFLVQPHLDSPWFPSAREDVVREAVAGLTHTTYALADGRAVLVEDGAVRVVGEGRYVVLPGGAG